MKLEDDEGGGGDDDLRGVWRAMRDEEPVLAEGTRPPLAEGTPAAIAKAAPLVALPAEPMKGSWWARVAARPMVLAFASVVILVGGALVVVRHADAPVPMAIATGSAAAPAAVESGVAAPVPPPVQTAPAPARLQASEDRAPATTERPTSRAKAADADAKPSGSALFREAEAAAQRGDCARARKLIAQIFRTEAGARARALKNTAIAKCMDE